MAVLLPNGKQAFEDGAGLPLIGGKLYTYAAGTNTPLPTFADAAGTIANTNPVSLDARGEATVFWSGTYKVVLKDAAGVTIWTVDNVIAAEIDATLRANLAGPSGALLIGYQRPEAGSVATNLDLKLDELGLTGVDVGLVPDGSTDNTVMIQKLVNTGTLPQLRAYAKAYIVSDKITIPAGVTLRLDTGVRIIWRGASGSQTDIRDVFYLKAGAGIRCPGLATVECEADQHHVYAVGSDYLDANGARIENIMGVRCKHFRINTGGYRWADMVSPKMKAAGDTRAMNMPSNIRVRGGGCIMDAASTNESGAVLAYCFDVKVSDCNWYRAGHGLVWWGGNSDPTVDGAVANERKAYDIEVRNCGAYNPTTGGIWGSMGARVRIWDSTCIECGDVGFDSEGCDGVEWHNCYARDCTNGNYTLFYLNRSIIAQGCSSVASNKSIPLIRIYNVTQSTDNQDFRWNGGKLICYDATGMGVADTAFGCIRNIEISDAYLYNAIIDLTANNNNQGAVRGCDFLWTVAPQFGFAGITWGGSQGTQARSRIAVEDNRFVSQVKQPIATSIATLNFSDNNNTSFGSVARNHVEVQLANNAYAGYRLAGAGTNSSIGAAVWVEFNRGDGPIVSVNAGLGGPYPTVYAQNNRNSTNQEIVPQQI